MKIPASVLAAFVLLAAFPSTAAASCSTVTVGEDTTPVCDPYTGPTTCVLVDEAESLDIIVDLCVPKLIS